VGESVCDLEVEIGAALTASVDRVDLTDYCVEEAMHARPADFGQVHAGGRGDFPRDRSMHLDFEYGGVHKFGLADGLVLLKYGG
jgi:hypothetical protein